MDARLGGGIIHLAVLTGLAIDAADIDDAPESAFPHAGKRELAEIEAGTKVGIDHRFPHVARHALQCAITGDAGIVHQNLDRPHLGRYLLDRPLAFLEVADIEANYADAVFLVKCGRGRLVAGIIGDHDAALVLQSGADGGTYASCSARHQCDPCHRFLPVFESRDPNTTRKNRKRAAQEFLPHQASIR